MQLACLALSRCGGDRQECAAAGSAPSSRGACHEQRPAGPDALRAVEYVKFSQRAMQRERRAAGNFANVRCMVWQTAHCHKQPTFLQPAPHDTLTCQIAISASGLRGVFGARRGDLGLLLPRPAPLHETTARLATHRLGVQDSNGSSCSPECCSRKKIAAS